MLENHLWHAKSLSLVAASLIGQFLLFLFPTITI